MSDLARRLAISTAIAAAVVVIGFLFLSVENAHKQIATVDQSQRAALEQLAEKRVEVQAEDRIITLPDDGSVYHTSVFVRADWHRRSQDRELLAWFGSDPRLQSLKAQTHFNIYTERSPLWKTRYSKTVGRLPCVRVQAASGRVTYQSSVDNLPKSADGLADEITGCIFKNRKKRRQPTPTPTPKPDVDVDVDVMPAPVIPDVVVPVKPAFPWLLLVVAVILAGIVPIIVHFKNAFRG